MSTFGSHPAFPALLRARVEAFQARTRGYALMLRVVEGITVLVTFH